MILGTHNSVTYLKPKKWYMKLVRIFWQCQKKNIQEQWAAGVRCFDLRITFEKDGTPVFAHGYAKLKGNVYDIINELLTMAEEDNSKVYIRLVCEDKSANDQIAEQFKKFCSIISIYYCTPFEGRRKGDWKLLYDFEYKPKLVQYVGSMASDARWYEKIIPWFYAKRKNKDNIPCKDITLYDFI